MKLAASLRALDYDSGLGSLYSYFVTYSLVWGKNKYVIGNCCDIKKNQKIYHGIFMYSEGVTSEGHLGFFFFKLSKEHTSQKINLL